MRHLKTALAVFGAVTILVLAGNTIALATTGHSFILGKSNSANKVTTLTRTTAGSALKLGTKSSSDAPLQVNGHGKVANLNADLLDGLDSSALRTNSYVFTKVVSVATSDVVIPISLPAGTYLMGYAAYMSGGETAGGSAGCYFARIINSSSTYSYFGESRMVTATGVVPSASGNGIISVGAGISLNLHCFTPAAFTTISAEPIQITATRVNVIGGGSLRVRSSARTIH